MVSSHESSNAPDWDLASIFPSLESPEYLAAFRRAGDLLTRLETDFQQNKIEKGTPAPPELVRQVLTAMGDLSKNLKLLRSYVSGMVTTDTGNETALARASELDPVMARSSKLGKALNGWLGGVDATKLMEEAIDLSPFGYLFTKAGVEVQHQLSPSEESLITDLEITGSTGWKKLHTNVSSQIQATVVVSGEERTCSMSELRALATDKSREMRRHAFEAELGAWKKWEVPLAAAMNGIKGETLTLSSRRGWESPLEAAIFSAGIDRATLDAMQQAVTNSFGVFRTYLKAKARRLGIEKMAFYDVFAPLPEATKDWNWKDAEEFVAHNFRQYSEKLGSFAERAFAERWIDYSPKVAKVDGAYCMGVRDDESRILMNFKPAFSAVSTLAHELGHAYHNVLLSERPELLRTSPMTLAETASIFCETIIRKAVLKSGSSEERMSVLEASLTGTCQVVVDIHSRFLFEAEVFKRRQARELSPAELCEVMTDAQRQTYGDGLDESLLHPYMWAAKPHYYGRAFYNFPYTFGLLFGLGLYAVYLQEGPSFQARYDDLLSSTGMADASDLADRFGIDIRDVSFWESSIDQIRAEIDLYDNLS